MLPFFITEFKFNEFGIKRPLGFDLTKINKSKYLSYSLLLKTLRV